MSTIIFLTTVYFICIFLYKKLITSITTSSSGHRPERKNDPFPKLVIGCVGLRAKSRDRGNQDKQLDN